MFVSVVAFSQDTDTTLQRAHYELVSTGTKTVIYHFRTDTINAESTDDTTVIAIPHQLATAFHAQLVIVQDTLTLDSLAGGPLAATLKVKESAGGTCPYNEIIDSGMTYDTDHGDSVVGNFYIRNALVIIEIISTAGKGIAELWLTIKPSSIPISQ